MCDMVGEHAKRCGSFSLSPSIHTFCQSSMRRLRHIRHIALHPSSVLLCFLCTLFAIQTHTHTHTHFEYVHSFTHTHWPHSPIPHSPYMVIASSNCSIQFSRLKFCNDENGQCHMETSYYVSVALNSTAPKTALTHSDHVNTCKKKTNT